MLNGDDTADPFTTPAFMVCHIFTSRSISHNCHCQYHQITYKRRIFLYLFIVSRFYFSASVILLSICIVLYMAAICGARARAHCCAMSSSCLCSLRFCALHPSVCAVSVCVSERVCLCACVCVCERESLCVWERACMLACLNNQWHTHITFYLLASLSIPYSYLSFSSPPATHVPTFRLAMATLKQMLTESQTSPLESRCILCN